jgi:uncharacterized radical SAM superfamily Fe-S cluster-containing enzyme
MIQKAYSHTQSVCSKCLKKIQAAIVKREDQVWMDKFCPEHGNQSVLLWENPEYYEKSLSFIKPRDNVLAHQVEEFRGCPESCGFCPEHQQHTCLPVVEINRDCNLNCPVCLKGEALDWQMSLAEFQTVLDSLNRSEKNVSVLNFSGGEPTLHPQLEQFIDKALTAGVTQLTISTNGLPLLKNPELRKMLKIKGVICALQMDGFQSATWKQLRGVDLSQQKMELIRILESEEMLYSLVCTVARGINDHEVTDLTDFFFRSRALSLMFQPLSLCGNALEKNNGFNGENRITTDRVITEIEKSSLVKTGDFNPLPCSHYSCFSLSYYLNAGEDYISLKEFLGEQDFLNVIANRTLPGLDVEGYGVMQERLYALWSAADSSDQSERVLSRVRQILRDLQKCPACAEERLKIGMQSMKAIFIHHFMDVETMDFGRLMKCCNPYPKGDGRLIPMCADNLPPEFFQRS